MSSGCRVLLELLVGDALGVPYEFHPPSATPSPELIESPKPDFSECGHKARNLS